MIPDETSVVSLEFLCQCISVEVGNSHSIGVKFPDWHIFLFLETVCYLLVLVSAHKFILHIKIIQGYVRYFVRKYYERLEKTA